MKITYILPFIAAVLLSCGNKTDGHIEMNKEKPEAFQEKSTPAKETSIQAPSSNLNANQFKAQIFDYTTAKEWNYKYNKACVIDFYADWCRPCKMLEPTLKSAVASYGGSVELFKVNIDKERELAQVFGIQSIPTLLFCPADGSQPFVLQGVLPEIELKKAIDKIK